MKGRKPIPTSLHVLSGTFRPGRHGKARAAEPVAADDLPVEPPETLSKTQADIWRHAVQTAPRGVLRRADHHTFLAWVVAVDQHEQARIAQAKLDAGDGPPLLMRQGAQLIPSPYLSIMHRTHLRMMKAASELGFAPTARLRQAGGRVDEKSDDEWDELARLVGKKDVWGKLDEPLEPLQ